MRFAHIIVSLGLLATTATEALPQNNPGRSGVAIARGSCVAVVVGGKKLPDCRPEVASVTLPDGTVQFIFTAGNQRYSFSGYGSAVRGGGNGMQMPVRFIAIGKGGADLDVIAAKGSCRSGNPYAGKPIKVHCSASSKIGEISATFITNGQPPAQR